MIIRSVPSRIDSPLLTLIAVTLPSRSDLISFSIFMASSIISVCPRFTVSPSFTLISRITPGNGDLIPDLPPLTAGLLIGVGGAAGVVDSVRTTGLILGLACFSNSTVYEVPFTYTRTLLSSISPTVTL